MTGDFGFYEGASGQFHREIPAYRLSNGRHRFQQQVRECVADDLAADLPASAARHMHLELAVALLPCQGTVGPVEFEDRNDGQAVVEPDRRLVPLLDFPVEYPFHLERPTDLLRRG